MEGRRSGQERGKKMTMTQMEGKEKSMDWVFLGGVGINVHNIENSQIMN